MAPTLKTGIRGAVVGPAAGLPKINERGSLRAGSITRRDITVYRDGLSATISKRQALQLWKEFLTGWQRWI